MPRSSEISHRCVDHHRPAWLDGLSVTSELLRWIAALLESLLTMAAKPMTTTRLYTANEIGNMLGQSRHWVLEHVEKDSAPPAEFTITRGKFAQPLWTEAALDQWRAYYAGPQSAPQTTYYRGTSDHRAVNQFGPVTVTWKLWWRCGPEGMMWWYSTPLGWFTSIDDGHHWSTNESMVRPPDYRYYPVNGAVAPNSATAAVLREVEKLRRRIE